MKKLNYGRAAELIATRGLSRGLFWGVGGSCCAVGAIMKAERVEGTRFLGFSSEELVRIYDFNDDPATTTDDVVMALLFMGRGAQP